MKTPYFEKPYFAVLASVFAMFVSSTGCGQDPTQNDEATDIATSTATDTASDQTNNAQAAHVANSIMSKDSPQAAEVKAEIDRLMDHAAQGKMEILDTIYHKDMQVYMLSPDLELSQMGKPAFISQLKEMVKDGNPSRWAKYHSVEASKNRGHVFISRKFREEEDRPKLTLSIDFVFEENRWQIIREVIVMR